MSVDEMEVKKVELRQTDGEYLFLKCHAGFVWEMVHLGAKMGERMRR